MKQRLASKMRQHEPLVLPSRLDALEEHGTTRSTATTTRTTTIIITTTSPPPTPPISSSGCRPKLRKTHPNNNKMMMHRRTRRRRLYPPSRSLVAWIASSIRLLVGFQFVLCASSSSIIGDIDADTGSSLDFVVTAAENRLDGVRIASLAGRMGAVSDSEMERGDAGDSKGFVVVDGSNRPVSALGDVCCAYHCTTTVQVIRPYLKSCWTRST